MRGVIRDRALFPTWYIRTSFFLCRYGKREDATGTMVSSSDERTLNYVLLIVYCYQRKKRTIYISNYALYAG